MKNLGSFLGKIEELFLSPKRSDWFWAYLAF